jgi:uncharacterized protein (DUF433 family)
MVGGPTSGIGCRDAFWSTLIRMSLLDRIVVDPEVRFGKPCIRGTRISVSDVLSYLAGGMIQDQVLQDFPQLTRDDIRACLTYAAERERRTAGIPAA